MVHLILKFGFTVWICSVVFHACNLASKILVEDGAESVMKSGLIVFWVTDHQHLQASPKSATLIVIQ